MISGRKREGRIAYSIILSLGALIGLLWIGFSARSNTAPRSAHAPPYNPIDVGIAAVVLGLIGARILHVAIHWSYYLQHPGEILAFWEGGLSWIGAALGVGIGLLIASRLWRTSFWNLGDLIAIPIALITAMSWLGCLIEGCAYGHTFPLDLPFLRSADFFGNVVARWPTQALGVTLTALLLLLLLFLADRKLPTGVLFLTCVGVIGIKMLFLNLVRGDPGYVIADVRLGALAALPLILFAGIGIVLRFRIT
jgi:phosphatidylglycerol:prolipoprotein diacylglycerol transferase